jgi:hypothetical protein
MSRHSALGNAMSFIAEARVIATVRQSGRDHDDRNAFCPFDLLLTSSKLMEGPWDC